MVIFLTSQAQTVFATVDYSNNHVFGNVALEQLIEVRDDDNDYDVVEAQNMIDRVGALPERMLKQIVARDVRLILMDVPLTDLPEFAYLSGVVPRGWEDTGLTWDDVPGAGGQTSAARIGYSDGAGGGVGHSSLNLELHELAHALDTFLAEISISDSPEFIALHEAEKEELFPEDAYFDYRSEYFAEVIAYYFLGEASRNELKDKAPDTFEFIDTLNSRILEIENRTDTTADLSWDPVPEATEYQIYRFEELIATVNSTSYVDTGITRLNSYVYHVKALNTDGDVIHETFEQWIDSLRPDAPNNFSASLEAEDTVALSWDAVEGATNYILRRDNEVIAETTETSFVDRGLEIGREYYYSLSFENNAEESNIIGTTIETGSTAEEPEVPTTPANLAVELTEDTVVTLSWDAVENAESYTILRDGEEVGTTADLSFIDATLAEETTYVFSVLAVNEAGTSEEATVEITTEAIPKVPETPENVEIELAAYNMVTFSWGPVDNANAYLILRNGEEIGTTTDLTYTDSDLEAETDYTYTILAVNEVGASDELVIEVTTDVAPNEEPDDVPEVPEMPNNLVAELPDYTTVTLSWDAVENAESYMILRDGDLIGTTTDLNFTDSDLAEDTSYTYTVLAINQEEVSEAAVVEIETEQVPVELEEPGEQEEPEVPEEPEEDIQESDGDRLPATATNIFTLLLIGAILIVSGGIVFLIIRRKTNHN